MSETLYVATLNRHKLQEIEELLGPLGFTVLPASELGRVEIVENGKTFLANARRKVRAYLRGSDPERVAHAWLLADDSGLEVEALGGAPGVFSSRYAGPGAGDAENNEKLLRELAGLPPERRRARFVCAVVAAHKGREVFACCGRAEGVILDRPRGSGGFGYDPLFLYPPLGRTFAELAAEEKNAVSHRGKALRAFASFMKTFLKGYRRLGALLEEQR